MMSLGTVSYATAAVAFSILAVFLLTNWKSRLCSIPLVVASTVSAFWASMYAYASYRGHLEIGPLYLIEVIRDEAWLVYLLWLFHRQKQYVLPPILQIVSYGLAAGWFLFALLLNLYPEFMKDLFNIKLALVYSGLSFSVLVLVLIEQLLRNIAVEHRWNIKFFFMGIGGLFAYDLFLYSYAVLYNDIDINVWSARGLANVLMVPLFIIAALRNPKDFFPMMVSHRAAMYTSSLLVIGIYLLLIATGGYYVRSYGGSWGEFVQVVFLFAGFMALVIAVLSGRARARLKVFISKNFFSYKYDYRAEWLRLIRALSSSSDGAPLPLRAIKAVAQIVESPGGVLWLQADDSSYSPAAEWNMRAPNNAELASGDAPLPLMRGRDWIIDMQEYRRNSTMYGSPEVSDWLMSWQEAWLIVPVINEDELAGFIVLAYPRAPMELVWEDFDLLKTVGRQVGSYLAQYRADQIIAETRQFEAYNRLTSYIMHDMKNLILQLSLVIKNAVKHRDNPEFIKTVINTVENSVGRMQRLLEQLSRGGGKGMDELVDVDRLVDQVIDAHQSTKPVPEKISSLKGSKVYMSPERLTLMLSHIICNAQDATDPDGKVQVELMCEKGDIIIRVRDSGRGMDKDFLINRLFRPFDSTKGSKGMGIGACQARDYVMQAGGTVKVRSEVGVGTIFTIRLPEARQEAGITTAGQPGDAGG